MVMAPPPGISFLDRPRRTRHHGELFLTLFPRIQLKPVQTPIAVAVAFIGDAVMKSFSSPHTLGLVSVPLHHAHASGSSSCREQRLAPDTLGSESANATRKSRKPALLAIALIATAVSLATVPVSYAIHRHLHP